MAASNGDSTPRHSPIEKYSSSEAIVESVGALSKNSQGALPTSVHHHYVINNLK